MEKIVLLILSGLGMTIGSFFAIAFFIGTVDVLHHTFIVAIYELRSIREFFLGIIVLIPLLAIDSWTIWPLVRLILKKFGFIIEIKKHGKPWPEQD